MLVELPAVGLQGVQSLADRPDLLAGLARLARVAVRPRLVLGDPLLVELDQFARVGQAAGVLRGSLARLADALLVLPDRGMQLGGGRFGLRHQVLPLDLQAGQVGKLLVELAQAAVQGGEPPPRDEQIEAAQFGFQFLVAPRASGLALQRADLALDFADHVGQPQQVGLGLLELAQRLLAVGLELGDPRRLLEDRAPVLGARRENGVDLPLRHHRVAGRADARPHEHPMDVLEAAGVLVEEVGALAGAEHAPRDGDFVEFGLQDAVAVGEGDADFRHVHRGPAVGAVEDHVQHLGPAQGGGPLLAQNPADGVRHIALAAPVGADNGDQAGLEDELRPVGEALEAGHF